MRPRGQLLPPRRAVGKLAELTATGLGAPVRVPGLEHLPQGPPTARPVLVEPQRSGPLGSRQDLAERDLAALIHELALGRQKDHA
eukprot:7053007-Alexandrium_andersonii.AAC.1